MANLIPTWQRFIQFHIAVGLLLVASCSAPKVVRDEHGCKIDPILDCEDMCAHADLGRCPAWIGSDMGKPGVCVESCRGVGRELVHCRLFAPTCSDAYQCYSMLQ